MLCLRLIAFALLGLTACSGDDGASASPPAGHGGADGSPGDGAKAEASAEAATDTGTTPESGLDVVIDAGPPPFAPGHVFIAGSRNGEVFEYDAKLQPVGHWTHPKFGQVLPPPGQSYANGPEGMVFDVQGRLVVATLTDFCVFSEPGVELACYPKIKPQPTENVIFDNEGHLYTTTETGGTNEVHKYDDKYQYMTTFSAPTGQLTGITCDPDSHLYVASQTGACIYKFDKTALTVLDTIPVAGTAEGLQFSGTDAILVAAWGGVPAIQRVKAVSPGDVLATMTLPDFAYPVPITTDNEGNVYTADYENGSGTAPADLYVISPAGDVLASRVASEVYGPFGIVVAGTKLPCGAYHGSIK